MELTNHGIGKRALALLLTAVLVLSLCATVMETRAEETYTVTFDTSELSLWPGWLKSPMVINAGEEIQIPSATMTDNFYVFLSWKDESGKEYYPGDIITPEHDMSFTAKTSYSMNYYQVIYRSSAEGGSGTQYRRAYKYNEIELVIPECPKGFTPAEGYSFDGWEVTSTAAGYSKSFGLGDIGQKIVTSGKDDYTMTAKWKAGKPDLFIYYHFNAEWYKDSTLYTDICQPISVKYDRANGAYESHTVLNPAVAFEHQSAFKVGDDIRAKGCVFAGWSTTPGGPVDSTYAVGNTVKLSDDLDLYAVWEEASYGYTVKQHYVNTDNSETVKDTSGTAQIDSPIPYDKGSIQHDGKTYVFDPGKEPKEQLITADTSKNIIDVYYDIDTLNDENDTTTEADGIADKYQRVVTYKVENGTWADGTTGDKTEVVTLMDGDYYAQEGTAQLTVPALGEPGNGNLEGRWSTPDGKAPTTVTASGPFEYTYHFLDKDEAIVIQPAEVHVTYDGTEHTFTEFTATKLSGELWPNITVELKQDADLAGCGWIDATESGGVTIDLNRKFSENNVNWKDIFDIKGLDAGQENNVTFGTGTIIIDPCPVEVELNVTELTELKAGIGSGKEGDKPVKPTYKYDQEDKELIAEFVFDGYEHTISLDPTIFNITDSKGNKVAVKLAPDDGSTTITLSATKVGDAVDATLDLTSATLELADAGADADNYTVGSSKAKTIFRAPIMNSSNEEEITDLAGKEVEKISIRIIPRPVSYWTYGGAKIYDGAGIPKDEDYTTSNMNHPEENNETKMDPEKKDKHVYIGEPRYEEIVKYDGEAIEKDARGFVVRGTTAGVSSYTTLNHRPWKVESESPIDVGIKDTEVTIVEFGNEYVKVDVMNDYAIEYHNGYYAIYPQSITDNPSFYDSGFDTIDTFKDASYDDKVIEYTYKDRDTKTAIPSAEELPAFYTGVKLTDDFVEAYPYDGKPHIAEAGALRNDNNAEGKQDLTEGTDYTVTYYRQDDKGVWNEISDDKDFVEPGKIKIVYQGIGNYRNRIEKEYSIVSGNGGLIPPDPPTPGGPDVEVDDHDHYAYIIGKPGGIVAPNGEITRAEIATVIFRLLKEEVREQYWFKENSFPDVEITDWYNNAVSTLEKLGVVEGKDDGLFHPDDPITRAEMATMMVRLYDYDVDTGGFHTKFDDVDPAAWYARYVAAAEELALFLGDGSTSHFYPDRSLTRAEAMTVYNRLLGRKPHKDGLLPEAQMILWPDNMDAAAWYYADVQEATNSHTCVIDGLAVGGERFERWLSPLPVRDWAALEQAWSEAHSGYDGHDVN